ncbi:hypothetical protein TNCV_3511941 [Trichonephila clavipes]|nr:hypothetical protein TNCV_3511941 [Trichonephila clavipes]
MKEELIALNYECSKCNERMGLYERKSAVLDGDFEWALSETEVNGENGKIWCSKRKKKKNGNSCIRPGFKFSWIKEYRQTGFGKCFFDARKFIDESSYDLPKDFKNKRVAQKKRMFDYEGGDQPVDSVKKPGPREMYLAHIKFRSCATCCRRDMMSTVEPNPIEALEELFINIYSPLQPAIGEFFPYSGNERVKGHRLLPMKIRQKQKQQPSESNSGYLCAIETPNHLSLEPDA